MICTVAPGPLKHTCWRQFAVQWQAWELAADLRISIGKKMSAPKIKRSAEKKFSWKKKSHQVFFSGKPLRTCNGLRMPKLKTGKTGRCKAVLCSCYVLFLLNSFSFSFPLTPTGGVAPWTPHWGPSAVPRPPLFS